MAGIPWLSAYWRRRDEERMRESEAELEANLELLRQRRRERRASVAFDKDDVDAAAAQLAYWWRMSFSDDYSQPECEASYWDMPARMALRAVAEDRKRHPEGFQHA